jgi:peptidoglycan hydrolase-like protein with peptidoglycan-binding domain
MFARRFSILVLFLAATLATASADEQLRSTQEELRRRNIYYGEIDGAQSPELSAAIKKYQARKGFSVTGQPDPETLRSLGLLPRQPGEPPPQELAWPTGPVLKSDVNVDVPAVAQQIAQQNGVSVRSIAPDVAPPEASSSVSSPSGVSIVSATSAPTHGSERLGPIRHATPPSIGEYINNYLKAACRNDLRNEIHFYADRLTYFQNGELDRRVVERALIKYEQEWRKRRYYLAGPVEYRTLPESGQISVKFRVNFVLKKPHVVVKGQTENALVIDAATADPRIVSIQEQRVRL